MRRRDYLLAQVLGRLVFLLLEVGALLGFSTLVFGVPIRGSLALLIACCVIGALAFGGIGLLVASRAKTVEAVSGLLNLVMLPMWLLSGVFFASSNFPEAMQPFIRLLPLTALNEALRSVMLEGGGPAAVAPATGPPCRLGTAELRRRPPYLPLALKFGQNRHLLSCDVSS